MMEQATSRREHRNPALRRLLGISTFYKILIANSIFIVMGTAAGLWESTNQPSTFVLLLAVVAGGIVINSLLIRLALAPFNDFSKIMNEVSKGNFSLRAHPHPLAEKMAAICYRSLNHMLDTLEKTVASLKEAKESARQHTKLVIAAQEDERKRIARELHDETSQVLATLMMGLEKVRIGMPELSPQCIESKAEIGALKGLTDKALVELHRLAFNLRPSLLDDMGLKHALSQLLREQVEKQGISFEFHWKGSEERLPRETEIAVFRIVQEAVTNSVKYAKAQMISISLERSPEKLDVEISDDGIGFDLKTVREKKANGLGLRGMEERVSLLSGSFGLHSETGKGTRITANIPIEELRIDSRSAGRGNAAAHPFNCFMSAVNAESVID